MSSLDIAIEKIRVHDLKKGDLLIFTVKGDTIESADDLEQLSEGLTKEIASISDIDVSVLLITDDIVDVQVAREIE